MPRTLILRATLLLAGICLAASIPSTSFAQQTQGQQPTADQQKKKPSGSAKATATKPPPAPAKDADKLTPERMSTRGLHKGNSDQGGKQDEQSKPKQDQQSTAKPDSQK